MSKSTWLNKAINLTKLQLADEQNKTKKILDTANTTYTSSKSAEDKKVFVQAQNLSWSLKYLEASLQDVKDALSSYQDGNNLTFKEALAENATNQDMWKWAKLNYTSVDLTNQIAGESDSATKKTL